MLNNNLCLFLNEASSAPKKKAKKERSIFSFTFSIRSNFSPSSRNQAHIFHEIRNGFGRGVHSGTMLKQRMIRETHVDLEYGDENEKYSANISFPQVSFLLLFKSDAEELFHFSNNLILGSSKLQPFSCGLL